MKKYITGQELLTSTTITSHDLADLILNEKIKAFHPQSHTSVFADLLDYWKEIVIDRKKRGIYLINKSVKKLDQTIASELDAFHEEVIPWLIEQMPELLFLIDEVAFIQREYPRPSSSKQINSSNDPTEKQIEPGTKLHAHEVKKHWGIDKLKLAEYVWEKGLPAFDQYGRKIPTVEMVVALNAIDLKNEPEKQKEFIADQIAYFISDDVLNFEYDHGIKPAPGKESTPAPQTEPQLDPEELIKSIAVSYLSDTEVIIKFKNNRIEASYDKIGFKEKSKPWMMFIKILCNGKYNVGSYAKDNDVVKNRQYNAERKLFSNFSKKFIPFINNQFSLNIPSGFNVFQNMKGFDHYGTYEPKFKIFDHSELKQKADIKNLSQKDTLYKIKELCQKNKRAIDVTSKEQILVEIGLYAEHAYNNKWITQKDLHNWLLMDDAEPSDYDAMSEIKALKEARIVFDE